MIAAGRAPGRRIRARLAAVPAILLTVCAVLFSQPSSHSCFLISDSNIYGVCSRITHMRYTIKLGDV